MPTAASAAPEAVLGALDPRLRANVRALAEAGKRALSEAEEVVLRWVPGAGGALVVHGWCTVPR